MCGIAGLLNMKHEPAPRHTIKQMSDAISHRGPDGEGQYVDGEFAACHRRLSIIDLSPNAAQPMMTACKRYVISYNGEVYNFKTLKAELEAIGHEFKSHSDTEVVLHAFKEWGHECFNMFNGMFAVAIWDTKERRLTLARDRYGIKPLYYFLNSNMFMFSSEIKAFIKHHDFKIELDKETLVEYFTFQNIFSHRTFFKGVHMLPPATIMTIKSGESPKFEEYWDFHFEDDPRMTDENECIEQLDYLFQQAVKRQLISDVEVSSYLSGGMDSGSITAIAASELDFMRTFTVGFDMTSASGMELNFDERSKAEYLSYMFKTEHYEAVLKSGDMERSLPHLTWALENLHVGQSYPNFYAARLASKFNKVVLSGAGGDEIFGGYPWRYYRAVGNHDFNGYVDRYYDLWQRLVPPEAREGFFKPLQDVYTQVDTKEIMASILRKAPNTLETSEAYINRSLYFEAKTFLHGLLVVEDKFSMAHGLESRVPFLDNDVVDFAMRTPAHFKLGNLGEVTRIVETDPGASLKRFFQKTSDGKLIFRKAMKRHISDEVVQRIKQGFSAPDASWFKGESIDYIHKKLFDKRAMLYDYVDRDTVHTLVNEHLHGEKNQRLLIWSLLNFEQWCQTFLI